MERWLGADQRLFASAEQDAYDVACAVTHGLSFPALEAARIKPNRRAGEHVMESGLTLRRDLDRLNDCGYVTPGCIFRVGDGLGDGFKDGRSYFRLDNTHVSIPINEVWRLNKELLAWQSGEV